MRRLQVLLANDNLDDHYFFKEALKEISIATHLTIATNGDELMNLLLNLRQLPDVLFIDFNLSRKNCFKCLIEMKSNKKLKSIPVIFYSTSVREEVMNLLYRYGAHYYLDKQDIIELPKKIQKVLNILAINPNQPAHG